MLIVNKTQIYTIKEINKYIKMRIDQDAVLSDVWLRGEISNFTHHSSGHMYFTLKDKDSRIKCVMFASHNARLKFIPRDGTKVLTRGAISVFERDGAYQFYAHAMEPDGLGSLYLAYEQLKLKLEEEGLFAASRKQALPLFPLTVGVITSPTGAAVRDVITTLQRRFPVANILLAPVQVQGEHAASSIVKAIHYMNEIKKCDVLIVGRGGGSLEELWAFNEEPVVRAIAASAIPIISAVGHETDFTLSDFAADIRAATPTAAAELAVPHLLDLKAKLKYNHEVLLRSMNYKVAQIRQRLDHLTASPSLVEPKRIVHKYAERIDYLQMALKSHLKGKVNKEKVALFTMDQKLARIHPEHRIKLNYKQIERIQEQLTHAINKVVTKQSNAFVSLTKQLDALSPLKVMSRGYGLVYDEDSSLVKSVNQVKVGSVLQLNVTDGKIDCEVIEIKGE